MNVMSNIERTLSEFERDVTALVERLGRRRGVTASRDIVAEDIVAAAAWLEDHLSYIQPFLQAISALAQDITVHFIRRADGSLYASTKKHWRYGESVIDTTSVIASPYWSIQTSPVVADHLKRLQGRG